MFERNNQIIFRLTDEECDRLKHLVSKSGLTQAGYIRHLINGVIPKDKPPPDYFSMMEELRRVGDSLDRIARDIHSYGIFDPKEYDENVAMYRQALRRITKAVIEPEKENLDGGHSNMEHQRQDRGRS